MMQEFVPYDTEFGDSINTCILKIRINLAAITLTRIRELFTNEDVTSEKIKEALVIIEKTLGDISA